MKRKTLTTAVLAGLTGVAGMISVANAVNVNPDGLGQVLIYPYYTARAGNDTLISVVNTSSQAKAAKVRFLEGLNSREVLDFNLYLSAFDVWTAAVTENPEGDGARLLIADSSCTVPYFFGGAGEQAFLDFEFTNENADGGTTALERVESGYFEILDMGTVFGDTRQMGTNLNTNERVLIGFSDDDAPAGTPTFSLVDIFGPQLAPDIQPDDPSAAIVSLRGSEYALTHEDVETEDGEIVSRPRNCDQLVTAWSTTNFGPLLGSQYWSRDRTTDIADPNGVGQFFGSGSIINVNEGTLLSYNAEAIDNWRDGEVHTNPGNRSPRIIDSDRDTSAVFQSGPQSVSQVTWSRPQDPVNAVLMNDTILNEYVVNPGIGAMTEWVFTFPTKRFHVDRELLGFAPATDASGNVIDADGNPVFVSNECAAVSGFTDGQALQPIDLNDPVFDQDTGEPACIAVIAQVAFIQPPLAPFGTAFDGDACEPFGFTTYNREEVGPRGGLFFFPPIVSPPPSGGSDPELEVDTLCYEANVVSFSPNEDVGTQSEIFGEPRFTTFPLADRFPAGWVEFRFGQGTVPDLGGDNPLGFPEDARTISSNGDGTGTVYEGLPVVGFGATTFSNATLSVGGQTVLSNYGGTFRHRGTRSIGFVED